jgi:predicted nucleic acid-binding Zn ribbon protein
MPIYMYECPNGHAHELFFKIVEKPESLNCHLCGQEAKQVPSIGGIQGDSPVWLNGEVREVLQDTDRVKKGLEKPIETRGEWEAAKRRLGVECVG